MVSTLGAQTVDSVVSGWRESFVERIVMKAFRRGIRPVLLVGVSDSRLQPEGFGCPHQGDGRTKKEKGDDITASEKKSLSDEEKEYKSKRKQIQEKLIKFATRIPAFMYLTDYRENTLFDVITKIEPGLFQAVTGLSVEDFNLLVSLGVFNAGHMNQAVFAFRRYEDASLSYTGIESQKGLRHYGLYDTVVAVDNAPTPVG
ncbi:hypothetical protein [Cryobacterium breve]|uniref:hypothetical protein n=1 Tax=Cryobacterium breve TaxID=1259258 RepID=UPI00248D1B1E|nr:hypothetical protein [Cryobacterium breve]